MADGFRDARPEALIVPIESMVPLTAGPDDFAKGVCRSMFFTGGGSVTFVTAAGETVTITPPDCMLLPVRCKRLTSGTGAYACY